MTLPYHPTSQFIYGDEARLLPWACARIEGGHQFRSDAVAIGHERNGKLVAVVGYDTFGKSDCAITLASDRSWRWSTPQFARVAMAYPFIQCGFARITCLIPAKNTDSVRYTRHFGWTQEGVMREAAYDGGDLLVFGMLRRECRYLSFAHGGAGIK